MTPTRDADDAAMLHLLKALLTPSVQATSQASESDDDDDDEEEEEEEEEEDKRAATCYSTQSWKRRKEELLALRAKTVALTSKLETLKRIRNPSRFWQDVAEGEKRRYEAAKGENGLLKVQLQTNKKAFKHVKQCLELSEIQKSNIFMGDAIAAMALHAEMNSGHHKQFVTSTVFDLLENRARLTEEVRCFVSDDPKELLKDRFQYIKEVAAKIQQYNVSKYESLLRKIINVHGLTDAEVPGLGLGKTYKMDDVNAWIQNGEFACFFDFHSMLTFGKKRSDYGKLKQCIGQVPVFGFNSGRYNINLIKADLFAVIGTDNITSVIKNPSYMCIATSDMKMLDIGNYVPAGTSYAKYLSTYLGECKCDDKIRCVCGLGKGIFPYEYITSFDVLSQPEVPPKSAFDSALRSTSISDEDYVRVQFVWEHYGMKSIKDLLIWYNNLDVVPFIKAIKAQRELFKRSELDMFTDGVRLSGYKTQDADADREFNMTLEHLNDLLERRKYLCGLCYKQLTADTASADRINNKLGHIDGNILISCVGCNVAHKNMPLKGFRHKKLLEFDSDRLVYSIDREEKDIYTKMNANIAGGPSIIFNRYAKRNEIKIRGGRICKKIIGYDANALYLWALGNEMPCGRLTTIEAYTGIVDDIVYDKIFGFLECDIRTPEHLKPYFSEMTPIFKNTLIDCSDRSVIGQHMFEYNEERKHSRLANSSGATLMMKLVGNSAFGRSGMDMSKHKEVRYESDDKAIKAKIEHFTFHGMEELNDSCEFTMKKRKFNNKDPIHLSIAIYQLAKLRMLQFYYDCIDFYFDRSEFQYQEMDTDSAYIAFSCEKPFVECIKPELREHFQQHKYEWFPRDYSEEMAQFDRRTPGLFKDEWSGDAMVKVSAKGVQQSGGRNGDVLNPDGFESVVCDRITLQGTNKGFRLSKETLYQKAKELEPKITMKIVKEWYSNQSDIQRFQEQKKRYDGSGGSYGDNSDLNVAELKAIMKNLIIHDRPQKTQAAVWATDLDKSTKKLRDSSVVRGSLVPHPRLKKRGEGGEDAGAVKAISYLLMMRLMGCLDCWRRLGAGIHADADATSRLRMGDWLLEMLGLLGLVNVHAGADAAHRTVGAQWQPTAEPAVDGCLVCWGCWCCWGRLGRFWHHALWGPKGCNAGAKTDASWGLGRLDGRGRDAEATDSMVKTPGRDRGC
ncbi:hypothetical protein PHYSODRAFT_339348 [Phytophthora sojae]|uniref:DNA-directed DNA polymerase n=1 Tax=Phytophthora sojae (strain P6497) TaxID=1094619 RepID=G5A6I6_PHYSP|nr:hypothetical protein PHYSODRAFT_339348 [Phytophthora sojae]EGZ08941.1 hypothetical protein PHYSODRAFT_339348 [Phytophthora sojae]|eukprot:XP_009535574.1 hypothetical protein PHYSODRAFT_339348 [Phytophthora sojae]